MHLFYESSYYDRWLKYLSCSVVSIKEIASGNRRMKTVYVTLFFGVMQTNFAAGKVINKITDGGWKPNKAVPETA